MREVTYCLAIASLLFSNLQAQVCDPSVVPTGLVSTYTPGSGALLEWDAVPASVGVQLKVELPSGSNINKRILGPERDQFFVPDALLGPGTYIWRVQAACSTIPPYDITPVSASSSFTVISGSPCPTMVTDIDGNVYNTVEIGSQCWMAENLKVEHYLNGDNIPTGLSDSVWSSTTNGAFEVFNNIAANKDIYGLLYNWYAVDDSRVLCPVGWHVPTDGEWTQLMDFLGGETVAGGKMKTTGVLSAGTGLWLDPNTSATNSSGFSGLPGGYRYHLGDFFNLGVTGYWWSSEESATFDPWNRTLYYAAGYVDRYRNYKQAGLSVRCLQD